MVVLMWKYSFLLAAAFVLSGCEEHDALAPPEDSEMVTLSVKVPEGLVARPIQVMYRSNRCLRDAVHADGRPYKIPGYQSIQLKPTGTAHSDIYENKIPIEGGGACDWRLSNIMFGVTYDDSSRFGEGVTPGTGGMVIVRFDNNNAPIGGGDIEVGGDLTIGREYYPWLEEKFIPRHRKTISLLGDGQGYEAYKAVQARRVHFEPTLHSGFLVRSIAPKVKKPGNHTRYFYPDGSMETSRRGKPDFRELQAIRRLAEQPDESAATAP